MAKELKSRAAYLQKLIQNHFPRQKDAAIFDLGCGHGAILHFARLAGYGNIQGVDCSSSQVAEARRLGIEDIMEGDLLDSLVSMPGDSQDLVIAFDVIEHFTKPELLPLVDQVYRVLAPEGRWLIHTPNGESPFAGRARYGDFTHELAFTRESLTQLLKSSGFSQVHCYEDQPVPHGITSAMRWLLWKAIRGVLRMYIAAETGSFGPEMIFSQNFLCVAVK